MRPCNFCSIRAVSELCRYGVSQYVFCTPRLLLPLLCRTLTMLVIDALLRQTKSKPGRFLTVRKEAMSLACPQLRQTLSIKLATLQFRGVMSLNAWER